MKNAHPHRAVIILFLATILCFGAFLLVNGMDVGVSLLLEVISFLLFATALCAAVYMVRKLIIRVKPRITGGRRPDSKE